MLKLTQRQSEILHLIEERLEVTGAPPTRAEIAKQMGFKSPNAAEDHLRALARKGMIELVPGTSRGIRLIHKDYGIPVIGRVSAGQPMLAEEHLESTLNISKKFFKPQLDYFLKVCGDSMKNAGILDNDLVGVYQTNEASPGQIVVARLDDEVTIKRFYKNDHSTVVLKPDNPDYQPKIIDLNHQNLVIEGIAVGVIRNL